MADPQVRPAEARKRRRQFLVMPLYQMQFALLMVAFQINVGVVYQGILQKRVVEVAERSGSLAAFLDTNLWTALLPWMIAASAVVAAIGYLFGLYFSNSIVGPLPRLRRALRQIAEGDTTTRLEFRRGDALEDLAADVNRLAATLHGRSAVGDVAAAARADTELEIEPAPV